ncbi:hypothetical protein ACQP00_27235 [Dactylosporangium sp. CS-047395]|uniref:hypothetical protein n=1 Tax=Dactylosporangium sp. CS-047395 TaxID=3239936 RepID=UPI003D8E82D9
MDDPRASSTELRRIAGTDPDPAVRAAAADLLIRWPEQAPPRPRPGVTPGQREDARAFAERLSATLDDAWFPVRFGPLRYLDHIAFRGLINAFVAALVTAERTDRARAVAVDRIGAVVAAWHAGAGPAVLADLPEKPCTDAALAAALTFVDPDQILAAVVEHLGAAGPGRRAALAALGGVTDLLGRVELPLGRRLDHRLLAVARCTCPRLETPA